jgi:type II secretory ATPase GspE/PulE/Tfp pilus assembly ATPase PilB-like protein
MPVPAGLRHLFGDDVPDVLRRGAGCIDLPEHRVRGRIGIYELLRMTPASRELILSRAFGKGRRRSRRSSA